MRLPIIASLKRELSAEAATDASLAASFSAAASNDSTSLRSDSSDAHTSSRKELRSEGLRSWASANTSLILCQRSGVSPPAAVRCGVEAGDGFSVVLITGTRRGIWLRAGGGDPKQEATN